MLAVSDLHTLRPMKCAQLKPDSVPNMLHQWPEVICLLFRFMMRQWDMHRLPICMYESEPFRKILGFTTSSWASSDTTGNGGRIAVVS